MQVEVKTHMSGEPIAIEPEASALTALDLMVEHGIRHLPVVDGGRVCGVLSFDDLRAAFPVQVSLREPLDASARAGLLEQSVGEVMTYGPFMVSRETPLEEAAALMAERRIGCLPVVDEDGGLVGILSETDLLQALVTILWAERRREAPATPRDVASVLEAERQHLESELRAHGHHEQEITEARRANPLDEADRGSLAEEERVTAGLADLAARRLRAIEHAMERQSQGLLGVCESCGGRIPEARLRALPSATRCIRCVQDKGEERRP